VQEEFKIDVQLNSKLKLNKDIPPKLEPLEKPHISKIKNIAK
jgi:hypothetical protein